MLTGRDPGDREGARPRRAHARRHRRYEVNEAFASVPLAWARETGADVAKLNPRGGAIALGHALGSCGTRLLTTLVNQLEAPAAATACRRCARAAAWPTPPSSSASTSHDARHERTPHGTRRRLRDRHRRRLGPRTRHRARTRRRRARTVVLVDLPGPRGEEAAAELGDRARFVPADVANEAEVQAAVDAASAPRTAARRRELRRHRAPRPHGRHATGPRRSTRSSARSASTSSARSTCMRLAAAAMAATSRSRCRRPTASAA